MDSTQTPLTQRPFWLPLLSRSRAKHCKELLLVMISFSLGILIWLLVVGADQMAMSLTVPIEFLNLPKHLVIYNQYQKEVNVTLSGPRSIMQELRSRPLSLPVDLAGAKPDTVVLNTDSLPLPLPGGVSLVRIQPASITLSIDEQVEKAISVAAETEGKVALGYVLEELVISPDKILVSGPRSLLERQQVLKTHLIKLEGLTRSATIPVHLELSPDLTSLIGETTVAVKLTVKEKFVEKIIHNIPVIVRDAGEPVLLKPAEISVFVSIPERLLADTQALPLLFRASVALGGGVLPRRVPVEVVAVTIPGHEQTLIKSYTPQEVEVLAITAPEPPMTEEIKPEVKPESKKPEKKNKKP
jgi:hypothetical protein